MFRVRPGCRSGFGLKNLETTMSISRRGFLLSGSALALGASVFPGMLYAQEQPETHSQGHLVAGHADRTHERRAAHSEPALRVHRVYLVASKIMEPLVDLNAQGEADPCWPNLGVHAGWPYHHLPPAQRVSPGTTGSHYVGRRPVRPWKSWKQHLNTARAAAVP